MSAATDLERLFKTGITAYQEGEYERAIASFSRLNQSKSATYQAKAKMGLVRVYMAQKEWDKAKALCMQLSTSPKPTVQQWSKKTLAKIARRSVVVNPVEHGSNAQGSSGFQLIEGDAVKRTVEPSPRKTSPSAQTTMTQTSVISKTVEPAPVSMFHYDYLNGEERNADKSLTEAEPVEQVVTSALAESAVLDGTDNSVSAKLGWIYAGRLNQGKSLGKIKRGQLRFMQVSGAIAFYVIWRSLIHQSVDAINGFLFFLDGILPFWVRSLPSSWRNVTWPLLAFFVTLTIASPWLWDFWLRFSADSQTCSASLLRKHSAESAKLINLYCRQRRWPFPTLWTLPTETPLIFSYGWLPRNARIVFSQGLLTQLSDDEIA
ncbi:MAG: tetratricopeptide repeat protein, partial [Cyanobacteria bacterium J06650_10]